MEAWDGEGRASPPGFVRSTALSRPLKGGWPLCAPGSARIISIILAAMSESTYAASPMSLHIASLEAAT